MKSTENENPTWRPNKIRQVRHLVTQFSKWQKLKYFILEVDISIHEDEGWMHSNIFLLKLTHNSTYAILLSINGRDGHEYD